MPTGESKLEKEVRLAIETLQAIYFLFLSLDTHSDRLQRILAFFPALLRADRLQTRDELREELAEVKERTGAIAKDREYRDLYKTICSYPGYYYLDKLYIDRSLFARYDIVFPRWPHIKDHATVIFDPQTKQGMGQVFELERQCLSDARSLLRKARDSEKGIADFRRRRAEDQRAVLTFSRAALLASINFVEAFLNGLAYDCFHTHHDRLVIEDHDQLAEWDSRKKRRKFVKFETKVFRYPVIVGRTRNLKVDLSGCKAAHVLIGDARELRDALVHPSPFIEPKTAHHLKFMIQVSVNAGIAERVLKNAISYVEAVEKAIGEDPRQTAPWLYEDT